MDSFSGYPDRELDLLGIALEVVPNQADQLSLATLRQVPDLAAEIAALGIQANPDQLGPILRAALQAAPGRRQSILNESLVINPRLERSIREVFRKETGVSDVPGGQTVVEQPVAESAAPPDPYVPPAPIYNYQSDDPVEDVNLASQGPPARARHRPVSERPAPRRSACLTWLLIGLVVTVIGGALIGGGYYLFDAFGSSTTGAGGSATTEAPNAQTQEAQALADQLIAEATEQAAIALASPAPTASSTALPQPTQEPSPQPPTGTATPSAPMFTASQNMFCREGPSSVYPERRTLLTGDQVPIIGQGISPVDNSSIWWYVMMSDADCYVSDGLGSTTGELGAVPLISAPPTPTATALPTFTPGPSPTP